MDFIFKDSGYRFSSVKFINPKEAAQIDRKLDDGLPNTGTIQAYGNGDYCYKPEGTGFIYDEAITTKSCGLYIKIRE